ncbi:hypothetical protein ABVT39_028007 [Epinephelus coioides]
MTDSGKKFSASGAPSKSNKGTCGAELEAIADTLMEKQREPQLPQLHEMAKCTDGKLSAIQTELASLSGSIRAIKADVSALKDETPEIMRAHRIFNGRSVRDRPHTLIFNVLRYTTHQDILRATRKEPVTIDGFFFFLFLLYPASLKIKDGPDYRVFNSPGEAVDFLNSLLIAMQERPLRAPVSEAVSRHTCGNAAQAASEDN